MNLPRATLAFLLLTCAATAEEIPKAPTVAPSPSAVDNPQGKPEFAEVRTELLPLWESDQKYRLELETLRRTHPAYKDEIQELNRKMQAADAANLPKLETILARYGWLGPDDVGRKASGVFFLAIQHSDLATQKKYLPVMREAVKAGKARGSSLALLEDRIELREGRPQIYGSQLRGDGGPFYVQAMIDPDRVDERRAAVGLPPMAEYLGNWNLIWDVDAYKARLPELLAQLSRTTPPRKQGE